MKSKLKCYSSFTEGEDTLFWNLVLEHRTCKEHMCHTTKLKANYAPRVPQENIIPLL